MTSLIKNQIIKRLSKFVKNLSSNQINLSALKGEGELSSINLDETALEEVTELPTWLKISKATCGRVFIKIPWTSLKTLPIQLQLDDVVIEIETCENLRNVQTSEMLPNSNNNDPLIGKYGFTNRVIDGISLTITNLTFQIRAQAFKASIFLPSLDIYSTTPDGRQVNNLTLTRVRNATRDHILLFKEISWPNARIEASAIKETVIPGTAIRLIANTCRIRIAMKKNLQDSSMVTSRVMIQFEDLLSVVNDAQLHSALNTYKEITHLMKKASEQRKRYAGEKLTRAERQQQQPSTFQPRAPGTNFNATSPFANVAAEPIKDAFGRYDVIETSLHFNIKRLDLHILADGEGQPDRFVENGSIQMTIANISIDHYPYHEYGTSKRHWNNYNEMQANNRNDWAQKLYDDWYEQLNTAKASVASDETSAKLEKALRTNRIRLFESATVLNIDDFVFYPVSLSQDKQQKRRRPLITSDKTYYQLPDSLGIINIQHSEYYYPSPYAFPVPNSDLYVQIMPLVLRVDFTTLSWLNSFLLTLSLTITKSGILKPNEIQQDFEHVAIQCEAMLPRIVLSSESFQRDETTNPSNGDVLELNVSKLVVTNVRSSHRKKLDEHLESFEKSTFFQQTQWPFSADASNRRISSLFDKHPYETYLYKNPLSQKTSSLPDPRLYDEALHTYYTMTTNSLKKSAKFDIWHFNVENIYLDFTPSSSSASIRLAKQNICDTLSLIGWAVLDEKHQDSTKTPWINVISIVETPTILKISQRQFIFLMHLIDELTIFLDLIERHQIETRRIKEIYSGKTRSKNDLKLTICLSVRTALTLAVIDRLQETIVQISHSNENEKETTLRDTSDSTVVIDVVTAPAAIIAGTTKIDPIPTNIASSVNFSDFSDETSSQMDLSEDLDADFESSALVNDFDVPQNKATRLNVEEDSWSLSGKTTLTTTAIDTANGVFIKLNQINVCITDEEIKENVPLYIACNVHHVRIDEFMSLRFDTIKPKLFQNEKIDEFNPNDVQPIDVRIDVIKGENSPPPHVALQIANRSLSIGSHAIEILVQTLDEKVSPEKNLPLKILPIDIFLHNLNLCLHLTEICPTTQLLIETKPTLNVNIEDLHILRQIDGQVKVQQTKPTEHFRSNSKENLNEIQSESELLRRENERLRSELNVYQTEISVLRGERDSLMKTISKLDIELTQAEYQRVAEQQKAVKKK